MTLALFTATEFKQFARISVTTWDTEIGVLATRISAAVETILNRSLELPDSDLSELHSGTGRSSMLRVRRYPITVLTSVHVSQDQTWDATTLVDSTAYVYDADSGIIRLRDRGAFWTAGVQNIRVLYRGGYDESTLPEQIKLGALLYATSIWNKAQDIGFTSASLAGFSTTLSQKAMPEEAKLLLSPFRKPIEYGDVL